MQRHLSREYTEKYSRGRRGAPAKGVGRLNRRESSNLSFSAIKETEFVYQTNSVSLNDVFRNAERDGFFESDAHFVRDVWLRQVKRNTSHHCK